MANNTQIHSFSAVIEDPDQGIDAAFVRIPFNVEKTYGTRGQVKIQATFDGHPYRGVLANMGMGCHIIGLRKDVRKAIGKGVGDKVKVTVQLDVAERVVDVPAPLAKLFKKNPSAKKFYDTLSYTNRKEYAFWISSAKKQETQDKRLEQTLIKLTAGKKNPSEK